MYTVFDCNNPKNLQKMSYTSLLRQVDSKFLNYFDTLFV